MNENESNSEIPSDSVVAISTMCAMPMTGAAGLLPAGVVMAVAKGASVALDLGPAADETVMSVSMFFAAACSTVSVVALTPTIWNTSERIATRLTARRPRP